MRVLPLTVQTLIENAVKHNEISKRNILKIDIYAEGNDRLVVSNNIQEKLSAEPSLGIGLSNLSKRYSILCGSEINITRDNLEFKVYIPL